MNKKGSAAVEAAIVFPVIITAVMVIIFIMTYFYNQVQEQVSMHVDMRSECGMLCNNMFYENHESDRTIYRKGHKVACYGTVNMNDNWFFEGKASEQYAEKYIVDESQIVRMADLINLKGMEDE